VDSLIKNMDKILFDLELLFKEKEINAQDFQNFLGKIKSGEVNNYLVALSKGSKPEQALREIFFTFNSKFAKFLFKDVFPEVSQEGGFIDYLIKENREEIGLEIKPLYKGVFKKERSGKIFSKIKKLKLDPDEHKKQIQKYLEGKRDYIVLTNLEDWYFYSKTSLLDQKNTPFTQVNLFELLKDFSQVEDFWHYLDVQEDLSIKEPLDNKFFVSLKNWVSELSSVKFTVEDNKKTELIINIINKFIFIQSLDSFWVISKHYIKEEWKSIERKWTAKNKQRILRKYLEDINEYFYELYDTELFKITEENKTILDFIKQDQDNILLLYQKFKLILGIEYGRSPNNWMPGIIQYNFRRIDEDILGKSYETFLAEIRKEQGIFYTPKYITQFIINNTIKKFFDENLLLFSDSLKKKEYEKCHELIKKIFHFRILDPACGSGSFLIKALKAIWTGYNFLNQTIEEMYEKYSDFQGKIIRSPDIESEFQEILKIKKLLSFQDKRRFISSIIIRHIHGVDLDSNAIEVAKLNLWLEAIKLAPKEFHFDKVPANTNHILPDLEMNLCNGDSLVGLPDQQVLDIIHSDYKSELKMLFELRNNYINEPANVELVKKIVDIKSEIKEKLNASFVDFLKQNGINVDIQNHTIPFFWTLDFWFVYLEQSIEIKKQEEMGFNAIIGNPPYFSIRGKGTGTLVQAYNYDFLQNASNWKEFFRSQSDIYYYFIILSIKLLQKSGIFGFIIESYWIENDYADRLKDCLLANANVELLLNFGKVKKIFEDADNDTCILIFEKEQEVEQEIAYIYCKQNFSIGSLQQNNQKLISHIVEMISKEDFSDDYIDIYKINQDSLGTSKWILSKSSKIDIISKIESNNETLGNLCEIGQGVVPGRKKEFTISREETENTGGYWKKIEEDYIEVIDNKNKISHKIEIPFIKPLITNSGIKRHYLIESDEYLVYTVPLQDGRFNINDYPGVLTYLKVYEDELKERYDYDDKEEKYPWYGYQRIQNIELFENSNVKILCPYRAPENSFALDEIGYFGTSDMYAITPKNNFQIDLNYLLGILNSKLLTFWYKLAGKTKGLILEFFATPLSRMPIYIASDGEQAKLGRIVSSISKKKKLFVEFYQIWIKFSEKYRNGTKTLQKLVLDDKMKIQNGEFDKVWISDISIFPDGEEEELFAEFNQFKLIIDDNSTLELYGVKGAEEILLLNLETKLREFRDIIYLEILQLLNSRKRVKNLNDIFSKTIISVIKPNIWEKSFNLVKYAKAKFDSRHKLRINNPIYLESIILNSENLVDAYVFKYYGLSISEIESVLNSLNTAKSIKDDIIKKFKKVEEI